MVAAHARQSTTDSLYPGQNYENLSQYLLRPYQNRPSEPRRGGFFASLHNLGTPGPHRATSFQRVADFEELQHLGESQNGHLLFLRGNPTPEWLNTIGYKCNVDPEFYLRHLDFRATAANPDYFALPSLPSSSRNILRLRWTTIGSRGGTTLNRKVHDQAEVELLRSHNAKRMKQYLDDISSGSNMKDCDSFVRRYSVHDETHFSFEQDVSICINPLGKSWIGKSGYHLLCLHIANKG